MTKIDELDEKLDKLAAVVEALVGNLPKAPAQVDVPPPNPQTDEDKDEDKWVDQELGGPSEPLPSEYRGVIDTILNKEFGIHVKSDLGNAVFTILVPKKYSTMSDEQWKMSHFDRRARVIPNVEGLEGVKLWADKVFSSFGPEYQAMIVADRIRSI